MFGEADLAARDDLPALWFRLQGAPDLARALALAAEVSACMRSHPEFEAVRAVFGELLGATMMPRAGGAPMNEHLMEDKTMLVTRARRRERE